MNSNGYTQGYFIGSFFRFLWLLLIASLVQFMFVYMFNINFVTLVILSIILSFFINTSFPISNGYPFFRHILINICVYVVQINVGVKLHPVIRNFYTPSTLWVILIFCSTLFGILYSIGRYNSGTSSKKLEIVGNLFLIIIFIASGFLFWWHGTVMFIIFRILLISFEVRTSNFITGIITKELEEKTYDYKGF